MRMMHHSPEMRPQYPEIIRTLNASLHHNDTSTLTMRKEMPLPQGHDVSKSPNSTSSLRVKSPSVMLKRRRSSIAKIMPEDAEEFQIDLSDKGNGNPAEKQPSAQTRERISLLMVFLVILAVLMTGFMVFSAAQLIQAVKFSETVQKTEN